jgi:hypothetical protein
MIRQVARYENNEGFCVVCEAALDMNIVEIFQYNCPCCCCKIRTRARDNPKHKQRSGKSKPECKSFAKLGILPVVEEKRLRSFKRQK